MLLAHARVETRPIPVILVQVALHRRYSYLDWLLTWEDLKDSTVITRYRIEKFHASMSNQDYRANRLQKEIIRIEQRRKARRRVS